MSVRSMRVPRAKSFSLLIWLLVCFPVLAGAAPDPDHDSTPGADSGIARLTLQVDPSEVTVALSAPALRLMGFARVPRTASEREALDLTTANLLNGAGLLRFNTMADCRLVEARLTEGFATGRDGATHAEIGPAGLFGARYRFACARPDRLESVAVGLFNGFPMLERVLVHYRLPEGQGGAELTPGNPVVSFIPF